MGRALRLGQISEVAAWEIARLGSCHFGKYPLEVATWEKSFGKIPNILINVLKKHKHEYLFHCWSDKDFKVNRAFVIFAWRVAWNYAYCPFKQDKLQCFLLFRLLRYFQMHMLKTKSIMQNLRVKNHLCAAIYENIKLYPLSVFLEKVTVCQNLTGKCSILSKSSNSNFTEPNIL